MTSRLVVDTDDAIPSAHEAVLCDSAVTCDRPGAHENLLRASWTCLDASSELLARAKLVLSRAV